MLPSSPSEQLLHRPSNPLWTADADQLPDFPKPNPEKAFASLKEIQPDGLPIRVPREDWKCARQRVLEDPAWKEWADQQCSEVNAWIVRHRDHTEWIAGWWHDFVSPKDGAFLIWSEDIPGEQVQTLVSENGDPVDVTPKIFGGWVYVFRRKHLDKVIDAARLFRLTDEIRYAEWAASQLDFYAEHYEEWPINTSKNLARLGCQSLDDATYLSRMAEAARILFDWASLSRRRMWFEKLFRPEVEMLEQSFHIIHNIATWQRSAQAQIALLYGDEEMWKRAVDGTYGLRAQLREGVTGDYFWYEQSPHYNDYVFSAVLPLLTFAGLLGRADQLREEAAIAQNLILSPLMIRFPDGMLPNPSDSHLTRSPSSWIARSYRILPTRLALNVEAKSWDTLVDPPTPSTNPMPLPEPVSLSMENTRFALLKKGPWQVFFHYGQVNRSHSQDEALNWSASFGEIDITHDPGTTGYGSPISNEYYRKGLNHNVPLIHGEGQAPWKRGELLHFDEREGVVSASQPDYRPGVSVRRSLRIDGDTLIDETAVTLTGEDAAATAQLGLALHLQGKPHLPAGFRKVPGFAKGRPPSFRYWNDVRAAEFADHAEIKVNFPGGLVLKVHFSTPGPFTLYQGSSPDLPSGHRAGFYLETSGCKAVFTTRFLPIQKS